jgi:O-methyltransferase involved in polyketide biosynthesis
MLDTYLVVLNIFTLILLGLVIYLSMRERRELLDRIMAKSLPEFKDNQKLEENNFDDGSANYVDIAEAREEIEGTK